MKIKHCVIHRLDRLPNSPDGNPRYRVFFVGGGSADTEPDAACCYTLPNADLQGVPVSVTYNAAGRITDVHLAANDTTEEHQ